MEYDLEDRTAIFAENVIDFVRSLPKEVVNQVLIKQVVRSAASIGANYMEAVQSSSKRDFRNKVRISGKEANETKHWLRLIAKASPTHKSESGKLWKEVHELTLIFGKIFRSSAE